MPMTWTLCGTPDWALWKGQQGRPPTAQKASAADGATDVAKALDGGVDQELGVAHDRDQQTQCRDRCSNGRRIGITSCSEGATAQAQEAQTEHCALGVNGLQACELLKLVHFSYSLSLVEVVRLLMTRLITRNP